MMARPRITMTTAMIIAMTTNSSLHRLLAWLSPSFPVGAFSYSHGLEYAVETERVKTRDDLVAWCASLLRFGSGLHDAMLFVACWRALDANDAALLSQIFELSFAMRPTSELALETQAQGAAFTRAIKDAWPHPDLDAVLPLKDAGSYPLSVACSAHAHGIDMGDALLAYLHAFAANLISAGVRLIPLGQTDGQIALRLIEADIAAATALAQSLPLEEIGSATPMLDFCSARHETQYTRLFRS